MPSPDRDRDRDDEARERPVALLVMAEYSVGDPVWNRPQGDGYPVDLAGLGISVSLVHRLRDWNEAFEMLARTDFRWKSPQAEKAWVEEGLLLANELQDELPDVDVRYAHQDDDRPLRTTWPGGPDRRARRRSGQ